MVTIFKFIWNNVWIRCATFLVVGVAIGIFFQQEKITSLKTSLDTSNKTVTTQKSTIDTLTKDNTFYKKAWSTSGTSTHKPDGTIITTWQASGGDAGGSSASSDTHGTSTGGSVATGSTQASSDDETKINPKTTALMAGPLLSTKGGLVGGEGIVQHDFIKNIGAFIGTSYIKNNSEFIFAVGPSYRF